VLGSRARYLVLRAFAVDPHRALYQRQIEVATDIPLRAVQRELERLTESGLLFRRAEGNRRYYQVDVDYPLFSDLRALVLKGARPIDRLRAALLEQAGLRLALLARDGAGVLEVGELPSEPVDLPAPYTAEQWTAEQFVRALEEDDPELEAFLRGGFDLIGVREDVLWRRIEAAGYDVAKGEGVP